jgi:hypothetical protein
MLKLVLCILCAFVIGLTTLQLRQQELELRHLAAAMEKKIESQQARLWNQQVQIACYTAPNALTTTVGHDLDLVPEAPIPPEVADWIGMNDIAE